MSFYPLEYLSALKRKKVIFAGVFSFVFLTSILFSLNWSNYEAFATVEVSRPEISIDVIEGGGSAIMTAEAMADLQISRLKQKVLSTSSLAEIITKLDLYPGQRKATPIAYVAEDMRKKIDVKLLSTSLANPASAQKASALQLSAIAFTLTFQYSNPVLAQKAVNELVSLFLDEDIKERRSTAKKTTEFLDGQIKILTENLEEQEKNIAEFQAKNGDIRPDALAFNQQAAASTTSRLLSIESEIISNLGVIGALKSQLAQTDPYARVLDEKGEVLTTPSIQLRALKSQYASLRAKYGPEHPDVIKVSRQMNALQDSLKPKNMSARIKAQINDVSAKLKISEEKYGKEHPDVISLKKQFDALNVQLEDASKEITSAGIIEDADNPSYLQIVAQLEAAEEQQVALKNQKDEVKKQEDEYRKAIAQNPGAEQHMAGMVRDYDNLMLLYRDLKAKKLASEMNETIEQGSIGQRLSIIEAPQVPLGTSPSRLMFVVAGFLLATMSAFGAVLGLQILNQTVIGPHHLESLIGVAPLATIPHLRTLDDRIYIRILGIKALTYAPIVLVVLIALFFFTVMPFDVFWDILLRKFD
jgi:succinoglycan biosynthesis transport protein ExoP